MDEKRSAILAAGEAEIVEPVLASKGSRAVIYIRNKDAANSASIKFFTGPDGVAFAAAQYQQLERDATTGRLKPGTTALVVAAATTVVVYVDDLNAYLSVRGSSAAGAAVDVWVVFEQQGA